ncbi:hypothetical protein R1sor_012449 [Riccia sorocarpa]|uniref:Uncharacterized protein n=1 Tax=Riccia sorocarpa TaxID=122646 RepID=A0ABD3I3T6_9MARC
MQDNFAHDRVNLLKVRDEESHYTVDTMKTCYWHSLLFGILALVPSSPFSHRETTLGIVLVILGATGVANIAGMIVGAVSGLGIGFCLDKTYRF